VLQALISGDKDLFLEREAAAREAQNLPPYGKLASLILSGPDKGKLQTISKVLSRSAPRHNDITVLGPVPAPLSYLRGNYRYRFLVKANASINIQNEISHWLSKIKSTRSVKIQVDIDPYSFY